MVIAEEDLLTDDKSVLKKLQTQIRELSGTGQLPKLALNSVGGSSASLLLKLLEPGGTMVTYGGMSGKPVQVATPQLIFKDVKVAGYWHSRWMVQASQADKQQMIDTLANAVIEQEVKCPPSKVFKLHDVQMALHWQAQQSNTAIRSKLVWDCQE
jgi:NADPH:quinone reductase-like Zn-dependent oxidoreductase